MGRKQKQSLSDRMGLLKELTDLNMKLLSNLTSPIYQIARKSSGPLNPVGESPIQSSPPPGSGTNTKAPTSIPSIKFDVRGWTQAPLINMKANIF